MRNSKLLGLVVMLTCVAVGLGVVGSAAGAGKKFVPEMTVYHGTYPYMGSHREVEASVMDSEKTHKLLVGFSVYLPATCNGEEASLPIKTEAALKGKTFQFHGKIPAAGEVPGNNDYVMGTIKGHFTSTKTFTVTFSASTSVEPGNPEPTVACTATPITVKMKEGPAPL
jgi:hypothetical protein